MAKCILVVDDDRLTIELVKKNLQTNAYEVLTARDGLEALEVLKKQVPDLILLDVQMPNMDGYAFVIEKKKDPTWAQIPVIVLTSMGKTEPMFKRHGARGYLLKPINTQELLDKIKTILST